MRKMLLIFLITLSVLTLVGYVLFVHFVGIPIYAEDYQCRIYLDKTLKISYYGGVEDEVVIPSEIDGYTVKAIGSLAFSDSNIKKVTIPSSVESIDTFAFESCPFLEEVVLREGLKTISDFAFSNCIKLKEIVIPDSVEVIGTSAFESCESLEYAYLGSGIRDIEHINNGILDATYNLAEAISETQPIYNGIFVDCKNLKAVEVSPSNFYYASRDNIIYTKDYKTLLYYPMSKEATEFRIPYFVENIGNTAFYNCLHLKKVTIGENVKYIGFDAFWRCANLESVEFASPEGWLYNGQPIALDNPNDVADWFKEGTAYMGFEKK